MRLLIVEDDEDIRTLLKFHLKSMGAEIDEALDGDEAVRKIRDNSYSLVLLDLLLPKLSGLEVLSFIRQEKPSLPVIVTSALNEESDIAAALEAGADDYVTKPFSPRILMLRVKSVLRRSETKKDTDIMTPGGVFLSPGSRECRVKNENIILTATEFDILQALIRADGRVLRRNEIIGKIKGDDYPVTERSIDVQIASLRKKLGQAGSAITTVWGIGYRYAEETGNQ